jgi:hypothetical protein
MYDASVPILLAFLILLVPSGSAFAREQAPGSPKSGPLLVITPDR